MGINRYRLRRRKVMRQSPGRKLDTMVSAWRVIGPILRVSVIVAAVVGIGYGSWTAVLNSPYFLVRNVQVESIPHITEAEVLEMAGLERKTNIFSFDAVSAQVNLLSHPWVAQAFVEKSLPDRVSIKLTERVPVGVLVLKRFFFVDVEGRPFIEVNAKEAKAYPLVTGLTKEQFESDPEGARSQIRRALNLVSMYSVRSMSRMWPLGSVAIGVGGRMNLMLGQTRVGLGTTHFKLKLDRLGQIYRALKRRRVGAEYILFGDDPSRVVGKESVLVGGEGTSFSLNATGARK